MKYVTWRGKCFISPDTSICQTSTNATAASKMSTNMEGKWVKSNVETTVNPGKRESLYTSVPLIPPT